MLSGSSTQALQGCKLSENRDLARIVTEKLRLQWSPEQIVGWLKHTYPCDENCHVSHETIYRSLFIQARGALKKELLRHLRRTRGMRRSRQYTQKTDVHGSIVDAVSISERPATVEDRAVPGHWGGDLLFGSANSQIATLVERQTRYVMLVKLDGKDSQTVVNALIKNARKLPQELYKSLNWDARAPAPRRRRSRASGRSPSRGRSRERAEGPRIRSGGGARRAGSSQAGTPGREGQAPRRGVGLVSPAAGVPARAGDAARACRGCTTAGNRDLASQLERLQAQSEREITSLRERHDSAKAALRQAETETR